MYKKPMLLKETSQDFGHHTLYPDCFQNTEMFGIEVELEGSGGISVPTLEIDNRWAKHDDGSLRKLAPGDECVEYVLRQPMTKQETITSLIMLMTFLKSDNKKVYDSYRTSIHVHVNCLADKLIHVYNFVTLCIIFDELLASLNGAHRIGNNFCLRTKDAEGQITDLVNSINTHGNLYGVNGNWRYSSINFVSFPKFGTVEFRSLEGTTNLARITAWINVIDRMKKASRTFVNPQEIIRGFSHANGPREFCELILGKEHTATYIQVPGFENMMFDGMRLAQDFAFCSNWTQKEEQPVKKTKKSMYTPLDIGNPMNPADPLHQLFPNWPPYPPPPQAGGWDVDEDDDEDYPDLPENEDDEQEDF